MIWYVTFPMLSTSSTFSRTWHQFMFSHTWHQFHVFPHLAPVHVFPRLPPLPCLSALGTGSYFHTLDTGSCFPALDTSSCFPTLATTSMSFFSALFADFSLLDTGSIYTFSSTFTGYMFSRLTPVTCFCLKFWLAYCSLATAVISSVFSVTVISKLQENP